MEIRKKLQNLKSINFALDETLLDEQFYLQQQYCRLLLQKVKKDSRQLCRSKFLKVSWL